MHVLIHERQPDILVILPWVVLLDHVYLCETTCHPPDKALKPSLDTLFRLLHIRSPLFWSITPAWTILYHQKHAPYTPFAKVSASYVLDKMPAECPRYFSGLLMYYVRIYLTRGSKTVAHE